MKQKWIIINKLENPLYLTSVVNGTWDSNVHKAFVFSDKRIANSIAIKYNGYVSEYGENNGK